MLTAEAVRPQPSARIADQRGCRDDGGKWHGKREDGHEGCHCNRPQCRVVQGARADAVRRMQHDRRHRRLDAVEQPCHQRQIVEGDIEPRQHDQQEQRGQHEQDPCHHAAPAPVHQPADVGGELLRLGARQQHAVVERVQKAPLGEPAPTLDEFLVHDRDLPGGSAKTDETELEPEAEGLAKTHRPRARVLGYGGSKVDCFHEGTTGSGSRNRFSGARFADRGAIIRAECETPQFAGRPTLLFHVHRVPAGDIARQHCQHGERQ